MDDNVAPAFAITILLVVGAEQALGVSLTTYFDSYMVHPSAAVGFNGDTTKTVKYLLPILFEAAKCTDNGYDCFHN